MMFREMTPRDRAFVVNTWVRSSKYRMPLRKRWQHVDSIIDSGAHVVILGGENGAVHAWACGDDDTLHYVYVAHEHGLRGNGLARLVIENLLGEYAERINVTHPWPGPSKRYRHVDHVRTAA